MNSVEENEQVKYLPVFLKQTVGMNLDLSVWQFSYRSLIYAVSYLHFPFCFSFPFIPFSFPSSPSFAFSFSPLLLMTFHPLGHPFSYLPSSLPSFPPSFFFLIKISRTSSYCLRHLLLSIQIDQFQMATGLEVLHVHNQTGLMAPLPPNDR